MSNPEGINHLTKAFDAGRQAGLQGYEDCPHVPGTDEHSWWWDGWQEGVLERQSYEDHDDYNHKHRPPKKKGGTKNSKNGKNGKKRRNNPMRNNKNGFTLIELLVVIAILAIFGSMVYSAVQNFRGKSGTHSQPTYQEPRYHSVTGETFQLPE